MVQMQILYVAGNSILELSVLYYYFGVNTIVLLGQVVFIEVDCVKTCVK